MVEVLQIGQLSAAYAQVHALKDSGVRFETIGEEEAVRLLTERTHYHKILAFLNSFDRWVSPEGEFGNYLNLDFGHLCELAKLDARLRYVILEASLDLEHFIKVHINAEATKRNLPDGACGPVAAFLEFDARRKEQELERLLDEASFHRAVKAINALRTEPVGQVGKALKAANIVYETTNGIDPHHIERSFHYLRDSVYTRSMVRDWRSGEPLNVGKFIEMVSFGDLIGFYKFFFLQYFDSKDPLVEEIRGLLFPAKTLRNAAAHNNALFHCAKETLPRPNGRIANKLKTDYQISELVVDNSKKIPLMHDLAALFICYDSIVIGAGTRRRLASKLAGSFSDLDAAASHMRSHDRLYSLLRGVSALCRAFEKAYLLSPR